MAAGFDAAGVVVALRVWEYGAAQVFLYGAELTRTSALRRGLRRSKAGTLTA